MDLDSKRMLDKEEEEEEEEGQTSRGSPVIGKCLHWQLNIVIKKSGKFVVVCKKATNFTTIINFDNFVHFDNFSF